MLKGDCQSHGRAEVLTLAARCTRLLTILVFLLFILACSSYVLIRGTASVSTRLQEAGTAAHKAKNYFDQREALLRHLGDSVLAGNLDEPTTDSEGTRPLPLDAAGGQPGQRLLLSARMEHRL